MHQHRLAYRFRYGVEGFVGFTLGDDPERARTSAVNRAKVKALALGEQFDEKYLITSSTQVEPKELVVIQKDWEIGAA